MIKLTEGHTAIVRSIANDRAGLDREYNKAVAAWEKGLKEYITMLVPLYDGASELRDPSLTMMEDGAYLAEGHEEQEEESP